MYSYVVNLGCRCVEINCWDGPKGEPLVSRGKLFNSEILLKDVFKILKDNSFKVFDTPFIILMEIHCGEEQQLKIVEYCKSILLNIWHPEVDLIPMYFPPPSKLKNKFIIQSNKPRVFRPYEPDKSKKYEPKADKSYEKNKAKQRNLKRRLSEIPELSEEYDITYRKRESRVSDFDLIRRRTEKNVTMKNMTLRDDEIKFSIMKEDIKEENLIEDIKKSKKTKSETIFELYDSIGLIETSLNLEKLSEFKYQPWDFASLSETKLHNNKKLRRNLIDYTSWSFLQVKPKFRRFDSSNFDIVKSWIVGTQIASLNLQSLNDDFTLINHIFFKNNNQFGYILKPEFLRSGSIENRSYEVPLFRMSFSVLSGIMLHKVLNEESSAIYITVNLIGSESDDNKNSLFKTEKVENFLHPRFFSTKEFLIFEPDLSFFLLKVLDDKDNILARSVIPVSNLMEGFRNIPLYDFNCDEIESSLIIISTKKLSY